MSVEAISAALHNSKSKGTTKLVLIGIANHEGDGGSWPTIETLGKYAACGRTTVKKAIKELVALGEIEVLSQQGGNQSTRPDRRPNLYRVLLTPYSRDGSQIGDRRTHARGSHSGERGSHLASTGVTRVTPNRPLEPSLIEMSSLDAFDDFWNAYPRRTAKQAARIAFDKALKSGTLPSVLIRAAEKFAGDPNRVDEFTPHPSTWLNQGRWEDEPLPSTSVGKRKQWDTVEKQKTREIIDRVVESDPNHVDATLRELKERLRLNASNSDKTSKETNWG